MRPCLSSSGDGEVPQHGLIIPPHQGLHASARFAATTSAISAHLPRLTYLFADAVLSAVRKNSSIIALASLMPGDSDSRLQGELSN